MGRFLMGRVLLAVPTLLGVSLVVFVTVKLIPGDPVTALLGPSASAASRAELTARLGLDAPLPEQYVRWLGHALTGDLGVSIARQVPVVDVLGAALGNTVILALAAFVPVVVGGALLGAAGAAFPGRWPGRLCDGLATLAISAPQYAVALLLVAFVAVGTGALPPGGMYDAADPGGPGDLALHLVLPATAAALVPMGLTARMFRTAMAGLLDGEMVEHLRARGLPERVVLRHAAHNAAPALLTIGGLQLAYLVEGVVFVETIFSWPGLGQLLFTALSQRDLPVIQGGVLVVAVAFVGINLLVDAAHGLIDPRVRR
ncbi:ABC transporter permease [Streptosporangium saharense]|uniref:Peptide/nickel transport system permease protein n=1 Tax=Streptosporangium saharense TaxID=1706840 RepID=A0A7W7VRU0_9ACTN|nr:ABC transporter permease [Streptosporangium saharense]MBB4920442.1 peptide/nickel transport system permease protein [Streptosporangium saharense]